MVYRAVGERLLLTLWVGALWAIGYIAAPVLFAALDDPALAGRLAGAMFSAVAVLSLICGAALLVLQALRTGWTRSWRFWAIAAMVALTAVGEFGVRPLMAGAEAAEFRRLHGVAQALFLAVSLLGLGLVTFWREEP